MDDQPLDWQGAELIPGRARRPYPRRRRGHGHDAAGRRPERRRGFPGPRGLQRDPQRDPPRRRRVACTRRTSPPAPTASRPTPSARTSATSASTTSSTGSASCPRPGPGSPGRPPTRTPPPTSRGTCSAPSVPARSCPPSGTSTTPRCGTRTRRTSAGLIVGGSDAIIIETCQDLLQAKSAIVGAHRAMAEVGRTVPIICHVTVETTGTMLRRQRDRRGADRARAARHRPDRTELRHRPGRDDRAPALPVAALPRTPVGHAQRRPAGARPPTVPTTRCQPDELAEALDRFVSEYGVSLVGGCCGTTPEHISRVVETVRGAHARSPASRVREPASRRSTTTCRSGRTPAC